MLQNKKEAEESNANWGKTDDDDNGGHWGGKNREGGRGLREMNKGEGSRRKTKTMGKEIDRTATKINNNQIKK
jgi:hypothetical protein